MTIDAQVDERPLREIYLASFEGAVKKSQPWTVMCAYNRLNGVYCSEHPYLLTDILKEEWGHEGFVVSDWGAVNERDQGLAAGLELEMPSSGGQGDRKIVKAVREGKLSEDVLDRAVERLLKVIFKAVDNRKEGASYDREGHHRLARETARESMVLLKNEGDILPLKKEGTLVVIGAFVQKPRYQGGGSSHVNPSRLDNPLEEMKKIAGDGVKILYAEGYKLDQETGMFGGQAFTSVSDTPDPELIREAKEIAKKADRAVIFAGLPDSYESESYDRRHMRIPEGHRRLIEEVAEVQENVVVVLCNGSPTEMPWLDKVKGVLEAYLGGQAFGGAVADLLFGEANPCGKLAETFPKRPEDNPSYLNFPGDGEKVEYREGIFVGYRYYDAREIEPLFPFGYGLSYTRFAYTGISLEKEEMTDQETLRVKVKVKNVGPVAGKEIIQLYVRDVESRVIRPRKELKGFEKVELQPGEEKEVVFTLDKRSFAYYDTTAKDWIVETGDFEILAGGSSRDLPLKAVVRVKSTKASKRLYTRNSPLGDLLEDPAAAEVIMKLMQSFGRPAPSEDAPKDREDLLKALPSIVKDMPLRSLIMFSGGRFSEEALEEMLKKLNQGAES